MTIFLTFYYHVCGSLALEKNIVEKKHRCIVALKKKSIVASPNNFKEAFCFQPAFCYAKCLKVYICFRYMSNTEFEKSQLPHEPYFLVILPAVRTINADPDRQCPHQGRPMTSILGWLGSGLLSRSISEALAQSLELAIVNFCHKLPGYNTYPVYV